MTMQTGVRACGEKYRKFDDEDYDSLDPDILVGKYKDIKDLIESSKGFALDEVQHAASDTVQTISDYSRSAKYRWGVSATPMRDKNDDILIEACFGKMFCDISASFLINRGYLVPPDIYFVPIGNMRSQKFPSLYSTVYKSAIVENAYRNEHIAKIARAFAAEGKTILILCQHIAHGETLSSMIEGSVFLHGSDSGDVRGDHLDKMREKMAPVTISSQIFDEGINVRALDTLILAGSGKSSTRALQRVGRTLRPYPGKTRATVIDFWDTCKYMLSHSKRRMKIYQTEPLFNVEMADGPE
jgi:superfamily II DNA or RNA helicase